MEETKSNQLRYPVLLVHGVFFRDGMRPAYWGRIPALLEQQGARVFFGNQQSAESVEASAAFLADRIRAILAETGCQKVNVIAHSKGGLDMRWAIARCGIAGQVASLTTVSTPHRGCRYVDVLLQKLPPWLLRLIAACYNGVMRRAGDPAPDFLAAVGELTETVCLPRDRELPLPEGILCRSVGSRLERGRGGRGIPRLAYPFVRRHDGPNDGLVGTHSMSWGQSFTLLEPTGRRGISHWDATDLHRESLSGFEPASFYLELVTQLKEQGL